MMQVVFLRAAEQDLKNLKSYIVRNFGTGIWQNSYQKIKMAVGVIREYPMKGSIPDELESLNISQYRQVLAEMNRILYEIKHETIYVHIVCDTRKDFKSLLMQRILKVN